jgi:hypothetical protein
VELSLKLNQDDVKDVSFMKVKAIIMEAKSYYVLIGLTVFYPMGFILDFWEETTNYRLGWQAGDGHKVQLPARFVRVLTGNLADLYAFFTFISVDSPWFIEDFVENAFATDSHVELDAHVNAKSLESVEVYQPGVKVA